MKYHLWWDETHQLAANQRPVETFQAHYFPKLGERSKMDVPIGSDYYILLLPIKEARGGDNQPSARLCPMEWTAIGTIGKRTCEGHGVSNTGCLNTYPMQQSECSDGDLKYLLKQF